MTSTHLHTFSVLSIILLGIVIYGNTLPNGFTYDDHFQIEQNEALRTWSQFVHRTSLYRPLTKLTWFADYHLWGLNPLGYHLTNLILHILASIALYSFVWRLLRRHWSAWAASIIFLAHPVHTESVASVANRGDVLAAVLVFSAWALMTTERPARWTTAGACGLFLLALLSKETTAVFPVLLLAQRRLLPAGQGRERAPLSTDLKLVSPLLVLSAIALGYAGCKLFITWGTFGQTWGSMGHSLSGGRSYGEILITELGAVPVYLRLLVAPSGLRADYYFPSDAPLHGMDAWLGLVFVAGLITIACLMLRRAATVSIGLLWFILFMLPVSNIVPGAFFVAERYLYIPSGGFCLIGAVALDRLRRAGAPSAMRFQWGATALLAVVTLSFSWLTISRNREWRDDLVLWRATLRENPLSAPARTNLGLAEMARKNYHEAIYHLEQAVALRPDLAEPHNNLGAAYGEAGRSLDAVAQFSVAAAIAPQVPKFRYNLALAHKEAGQIDSAIRELVRVVELWPEFAGAHYELGLLYLEAGDLEDARRHFALSGRNARDEPDENGSGRTNTR